MATATTLAKPVERPTDRLSVMASIPFFAVHVACFAAFFVTFHWYYPIVAIALYYMGMFFVTAGYHRYFSHRSFKTSRAFQFFLAFMAMTSSQKGVLWWAAHHRNHHRFSDTEEDIHSPSLRGFLWSHVGWILCATYNETEVDMIRDFHKFPELRFLNRYFLIPPVLFAVTMFLIGGWGLLVWGFFIRTVMLWHGSFTINSLSHVFGRRRYPTTDTSKNNWFLALVTMGEGWHNNHHHYMASVRQGFFWYEVDATYYTLKILSWFHIVWDLRMPPMEVLRATEASS